MRDHITVYHVTQDTIKSSIIRGVVLVPTKELSSQATKNLKVRVSCDVM